MGVVVVGVALVLVLALAAWSDRRDRRNGRDPAARAASVQRNRKEYRRARHDIRAERLARKTGAETSAPDRQPWER